MALVSVIVPMHSVEEYLPDTLASLQNQTFSDLQIVLVDDDSPDDVAMIARAAAEHDPRVIYVHQSNRGPGPGGGRNGGLATATGDYVMFVDADDVLVPAAIEQMMSAALAVDADLVTCNAARLKGGAVHRSEFHDLGHRETMAETTAVQSPWLMFDSTPWNKIFRREFFDREIGQWPERVLYEDIAVMTRAHLRSERTAVLSEALYYWRVRGAGQITQKTASIDGDLEHLRELRHGAAEIHRWGRPAQLDWFSWKAYGFDLAWMTRKLGRINPNDAATLAAAMTDTFELLSTAAFDALPPRIRAGFDVVTSFETRGARARLLAMNWRLHPVSVGFDIQSRDPMADLLSWDVRDRQLEFSIQVDATSAEQWVLEVGTESLLVKPTTAVATQMGTRQRNARRGRTTVTFRLPLDEGLLDGSQPLVHLAVATTSGSWRGEVGRSLRDRVSGRLGKTRALVTNVATVVPFFDNNRLMIALTPSDTGVTQVEQVGDRLVFSLDPQLAESVSNLGLCSEHRHAPRPLTHDAGHQWSVALADVIADFEAGYTLLGLAAGLHESPSVPVPVRGQADAATEHPGVDVFLGGYGQVFLRPPHSFARDAEPLVGAVRRALPSSR